MKKNLEASNLPLNKIFLKKQDCIKKEVNILEIGSGYGSMTAWLQNRGCTIIGIDVDKERLSYAKKKHNKYNYKYMDGENLKFKNNTFDYVLSFDVIEHIPDVAKHIKEVKRVLKPKGKYLFLTPNKFVNIFYLLLNAIFIKRTLKKWKGGHISLQNKKSLKKHFNKNNMTIEFIKLKEYQEYLKKKLKFPLYYALIFIDVGLYCVATKNNIDKYNKNN